MADISLVSRVRTRRNYSKKDGKNSKNTTRRATSAICGAEQPKTSTIEGELNIDRGKHVLALFLN